MIAGVVLAGGKSRRFGRNKALELFSGERLIDRVVKSLRSICEHVLVVANELDSYIDVKAHLVQDVIPDQGPLGGLYTGLLFSPLEWVLVKATDMPFWIPELIELLLAKRQGVDAVVPLSSKGYEPLLALYNVRCLPFIVRTLALGKRKIIDFYRMAKVTTVDEKEWREVDPEGRSFLNINTQLDLHELERNYTAAPPFTDSRHYGRNDR